MTSTNSAYANYNVIECKLTHSTLNKQKETKRKAKKKKNQIVHKSKKKTPEIAYLLVSVSSPQINGGYPDPTVIFSTSDNFHVYMQPATQATRTILH